MLVFGVCVCVCVCVVFFVVVVCFCVFVFLCFLKELRLPVFKVIIGTKAAFVYMFYCFFCCCFFFSCFKLNTLKPFRVLLIVLEFKMTTAAKATSVYASTVLSGRLTLNTLTFFSFIFRVRDLLCLKFHSFTRFSVLF